MEKNFAGIGRIIRILDEELTELQTAGLYREAEQTRKSLEVYLDMRDRGNQIAEGLPDDGERQL